MKKKVILSTIVSFLLLFAVVAVGLNAIFTVTVVNADFCVYSEDGRGEAEALKADLDKFVGKSSTFLKIEDVEKTVRSYPAFRVTQVRKKYPEAVEVSVCERKETYAFKTENGFSLLDENGCYLYDKKENTNRLGGGNILLEGFEFSVSEREFVTGEHAQTLFEAFGAFSEKLTEIRANVTGAAFVKASSSTSYFRFYMREGVAIDLYGADRMVKEKAQAAAEKYLSLSDLERTEGVISVVYTNAGQLNVDYRA